MSEHRRGGHELQSIQILRAVAALGVLVYHTSHELSERTPLTGFLSDILIGAAGVDLFFVISGFVMVYASEALFAQRGAPRYFLARRLARIVPLYWATTLFFLLYMFAAHRSLPPAITLNGVWASFVFLPWPRTDGLMGPVHALGWTLNYEMFFYLVFAAMLWLPRRSAVLSILAIYLALVFGTWTTPLPEPFNHWRSPIILEFCYGMVIAFVYREGVRLPRAGTYALFAVALIGYAISIKIGFIPLWRFVEWGLPSAALVAAFALAQEGQGSPGPFARAFAFLGDASYSIYLVHPIAFPFIRRGLLPFLPVENAFGQFLYAALLIAASIALSAASYLWFERPITRALQRRIDRWRPAGAARRKDGEPELKTVAP